MYRILRPNGQWITHSLPDDDCNLNTLEGAARLARRFARITADHGEFLIFEIGRDTPSASTRLERLIEDDDAQET